MAVSGNTQAGMYGDHATETHYPRTYADARVLQAELRLTGLYRRVEVREWNNGSRKNPLPAYKVMAWKKR